MTTRAFYSIEDQDGFVDDKPGFKFVLMRNITAPRSVDLPRASKGAIIFVVDDTNSAGVTNTITLVPYPGDPHNAADSAPSPAVINSAGGILAVVTDGNNGWSVLQPGDQTLINLTAIYAAIVRLAPVIIFGPDVDGNTIVLDLLDALGGSPILSVQANGTVALNP